MDDFQVLEEDEGIEAAIRGKLSSAAVGEMEGQRELRPALVVISPRAAKRKTLDLPSSCRTVLLPGDAGALLSGLEAASAVSYGTSPRDTLTVSSREGDHLWAALQRELVTLEGQVVDRQEFPLSLAPGKGELESLAVVGALLLLGFPPEELEKPE